MPASPLRCLQARNSRLDQNLNPQTLFSFSFLPSYISSYKTTQMYTHTHIHTRTLTFNASPCLPLTCVIVRSRAVTSRRHTTKLRGKFISEAIAHQASHLCLALGPSVGQDLPSMIGSFFIPKHSSSFPRNPTGFK